MSGPVGSETKPDNFVPFFLLYTKEDTTEGTKEGQLNGIGWLLPRVIGYKSPRYETKTFNLGLILSLNEAPEFFFKEYSKTYRALHIFLNSNPESKLCQV